MKKLILSIFLSVLIFTSSANAMDLNTARKTGVVGEKPDGYIAAIDPAPPAEVINLVNQVNAKRKSAYEQVSKKNGQSLSVVESLAGQKLINNLGPGDYYQNSTGGWIRK